MKRRVLDEAGFLDRVLKMSVALTIFIALFLLGVARVWEAVSFLMGAALGLGFLWSGRWAIQKMFAPGKSSFKALGVAVLACKYGVAGVIVWAVVRWPHAHLLAFAAGVGITQLVLFLKALGQVWADRVAEETPSRLTRIRQ